MSVDKCQVDQVAGQPQHGQCGSAADYVVRHATADDVARAHRGASGRCPCPLFSCLDCLSGACEEVGGTAWRIDRARISR